MSFMDVIRYIIRSGAQSVMTEEEFIEVETAAWLASEKRRQMMIGEAYARGEHDVLYKTRSAIGDGGKKTTVRNLPNNIIIDNQYGKLVNQKASYLLAKPFEVKTEDERFGAQLQSVFNQGFRRTLKQIGEDCLNAGVGYLYPYFADNELRFRRFAPEEILPFWMDDAHEELASFLRVYTLEYYEGRTKKQSIKVQYFSKEGVRYFTFDSGKLLPDVEAEDSPYLQVGGVPMNWDRVPLIMFRANSAERPLISRVKSLQDALNTLLSTFADNLQEDARSTLLVIHNYDGQELGDFRKNLSTFGAIKVRDSETAKGGVETLSIEVNAQNYELEDYSIEEAAKDGIDVTCPLKFKQYRPYGTKECEVTKDENGVEHLSVKETRPATGKTIPEAYKVQNEKSIWEVAKGTSNGSVDWRSIMKGNGLTNPFVVPPSGEVLQFG